MGCRGHFGPQAEFSGWNTGSNTIILLSWFQNKACVTLDRSFILALIYVAIWSNHAVINFIGNYFKTYFCHVIFKKIRKNRIFACLVPNVW